VKVPAVLRRKGVREALERFVAQVKELPEVEAILLAAGDEGWEVWTVLAEWDDAAVDAIVEQEGRLLDDLIAQGKETGAPGFHILIRQGKPLDEFLSPAARFLFRRG